MKNGVKNSFLAISQLIKGVLISLPHCYGDFQCQDDFNLNHRSAREQIRT